MKDENGIAYEECIVGNIIDKHYWGQHKEIKKGSKHFRPGAKVYCLFMYGGMAHDYLRVMGKPRTSFRMIDVVIKATYIKNFRIQKVYQPKIISFIKKHQAANPHDIVTWPLETLNKMHIEISNENDTV